MLERPREWLRIVIRLVWLCLVVCGNDLPDADLRSERSVKPLYLGNLFWLRFENSGRAVNLYCSCILVFEDHWTT
jgi:hypothetical protein